MRHLIVLLIASVLAGPASAQMSDEQQRSIDEIAVGAAGRNYATAEICGQPPSALAKIRVYTRAKYGSKVNFDVLFDEGIVAGHKMHDAAVQLLASRPDHGAKAFADQCQKSRANAVIYSGGRR